MVEADRRFKIVEGSPELQEKLALAINLQSENLNLILKSVLTSLRIKYCPPNLTRVSRNKSRVWKFFSFFFSIHVN